MSGPQGNPTEEKRPSLGEGVAYSHWHAHEWVPSAGIPFSAQDCRTCYDKWAKLQQRVS